MFAIVTSRVLRIPALALLGGLVIVVLGITVGAEVTQFTGRVVGGTATHQTTEENR
jgi:xanthosine utilization system XapX-like protein